MTLAVFLGLALAPAARTQQPAPTQSPAAGAASSASSDEEQNMQEYIALLRKDIRSQKAAVMRTVMQLDTDQAAKFWPIYRDYEDELHKLSDMKVANITEYSRTYNNMTDAKADELARNALSFQKQRAELLTQYYEKMRQALGGITAARFLQVEEQLQLIIDLQIDSALPIVGSAVASTQE